MGPVSRAQQMTAEEFIAAPEPQRGRPWNLIDGEVVVNLPTLAHRQAQDSILFALQVWVRAAQGRGAAGSPADIGLDERNVFAPDVMWHAADRMPALDSRPPYPMPDLAVEVRSPATWRFDLGAKKAEYERRGLPSCGWWTPTRAPSWSTAAPEPTPPGSMSRSSCQRASISLHRCCLGSISRSSKCSGSPEICRALDALADC